MHWAGHEFLTTSACPWAGRRRELGATLSPKRNPPPGHRRHLRPTYQRSSHFLTDWEPVERLGLTGLLHSDRTRISVFGIGLRNSTPSRVPDKSSMQKQARRLRFHLRVWDLHMHVTDKSVGSLNATWPKFYFRPLPSCMFMFYFQILRSQLLTCIAKPPQSYFIKALQVRGDVLTRCSQSPQCKGMGLDIVQIFE